MWCQENISILFVALVFVRTVTCLEHMDDTRLACFSSTHAAALGLHIVYDGSNDHKNLYTNTKDSLPFCNSSSSVSSSSSTCSACIYDSVSPKTVLVLCYNLTDDVKLNMETRDEAIPFNKTSCPTRPPVEDQRKQLEADAADADDDATFWTGPLLIVVVVLVIVIIVCVIYRRRRAQPKGNHGSNGGPGQSTANKTNDGLLLEASKNKGDVENGSVGTQVLTQGP